MPTIDQEEQGDLTELSGPAPVQHRDDASRGHRPDHRQEKHASEDVEEEEQRDLTELSAPGPVQQEDESGDWRREEHLEEAESEAYTDAEEPHRGSELLNQLYIVSYLIFFSFMGTLARLGVQWLTFYPGAPVVISNLWANFGGTFVMGFLSEDRKLFREEWGTKVQEAPGGSESSEDEKQKTEKQHQRGSPEARAAHGKVKKTIPLFIGLATGFCGSFTSFSSFMRDVFYALSNAVPSPINHPMTPPGAKVTSSAPRNNGYSVSAVLAIIILTITVSNGALMLGAHVAIGTDRVTPTLPFRFLRRVMDPFFVFLAFGCWLGAILMSVFPPDRTGGPVSQGPGSAERWRGEVLFALVFSPIGCLMRFYLSLKLNGILPWFPLGTFAANMFGVAILSMSFDFQHVALSSSSALAGGGIVGCQVLQGIEDGFCGCLTTVSTWILELDSLRRRHAYLYGGTTLTVGIGLVVVIMGSVRWSVGYTDLACVVSNS